MAERRRLPVLSNAPPVEPVEPDDEEAPRRPWHWVGFGTVCIFAGWLPLAYVGGAVSAKVMASRFGADASKDAIDLALMTMTAGERARLMAIVALPSILGLALAAFGGGFVVGRFGAPAGVREAAYSGVATALLATVVAWAGPTTSSFIAAGVTLAIALGFAAWGGRLGMSRRP